MPLTDRERELLRLLDMYRDHLQQQLTVDAAAVEPFGALDAAVQRWLQLAIQCCDETMSVNVNVRTAFCQAKPRRGRCG